MQSTLRAAFAALALTPVALAVQAQSPTPAATTPTVRSQAETPVPDKGHLPAVVVSGKGQPDETHKKLEAEQALTPGGVSLVDAEGLKQRNVTSLADALRYVPGLWAASGSTGDSSYLSMRGSNLDATNYDGNGIKLLVDGLPVTAADGNNHNRDVDPLAARYVIVARGANALTYGASTLGGAIDFITPTARDGAPNELSVSGGSFGLRQARATLGMVAGDFDGLVTVEAKKSDGYRQHQRQERSGLYANAGLQLGSSLKTRFYASAIDNEQQLPGGLTRAQLQADPRQGHAGAITGDYQYNVKTWRLANKTTWAIDADSSLTAGISHERQALFHPIVYAPPFFSLLIDTEQRNTGATLRYQHKAGSHDLLVGLNIGRTTVTGGNFSYSPSTWSATMSTRVDNDAQGLEAFVMDRWQFAPGWTAIYGLQAVKGEREIRNTTVTTGALRNPKADDDSLNPRVGLIRELSPSVQLFANLSRLFEAPTLYELEDDVRGNNAVLEPMKGTVVEIGTRGKHTDARNNWHWEVALYHARLKDEILSKDSPTAPGTSLSLNVDGTVHAGVEALVGASLAVDETGAHRIEPMLSLTLNHFRFKGDATYGDRSLPAAPRYALKGEVLYRHASGYFAGPTFDLVGKRWADFSNTYEVEAYRIWGLRAGYTAKNWELWAEARNLGDKKYTSLFSVKDKAGANDAILTPGAPRSVYVGARLLF